MNGIIDIAGNIAFSIYNALPIAPPAILVALAIRHARGGRVTSWQTVGLVAFAMYMYSMLDLTIFSRLGAVLAGEQVAHTLSAVPFDGIVTMATTEYAGVSYNVFMRNILGNAIMFLPLGFFLPLLWPKLRCFTKALAICALCSLAIEFTQYWIGGIADIDDLLLNTTGAGLGYAAYALGCRAKPVIKYRFAIFGVKQGLAS